MSLGWSIRDFIELEKNFIEKVLSNVDGDDSAVFDHRRKKTRARVRRILNPNAVHDLQNYVQRIPGDQTRLWSAETVEGFNKWLKSLVVEAGVKENGSIRFHLIRKYTFDVVTSQCGPYGAKLLIGKTIALEDETYLHGLEDRLLERYKKFVFPFLNLNGEWRQKQEKIQDLEKKLESLGEELQRKIKEKA